MENLFQCFYHNIINSKKSKFDTIIDLDIERAKSNCIKSGLKKETVEKINFVNSLDSILNRNIEIFIEATGNPVAGTQHACKVIQAKKDIIMVNVEADVLCGKIFIRPCKGK